MSRIRLTPALTAQYQDLFTRCQIREDRQPAVEDLLARITASRSRYEAVGAAAQVPWHVVAVIHAMEASLDFSRHLHNGDPLQGRTVHVPKGRPLQGSPPFTWEESATDALLLKRMDQWTDWSLPGTLYKLEEYNGWGYRRFHPEVLSPYLWSFSNHYTSGKYVADGTWSSTAVSRQCGAAVLLRRMAERGLIATDAPPKAAPGPPEPAAQPAGHPLPMVRHAPGERSAHVEALQRLLNEVGLFVRVDGKAGDKTSEAFRTFSGYYLQGDPRADGDTHRLAEE